MKRTIVAILISLSAVLSLAVPASQAAPKPRSGYIGIDPNGTHWHCQDLRSGLTAWSCISGFGYNYGGLWAYLFTDYQHPHPDTDYVSAELYYNQDSPNGMTQTAQWKHRVIAVNDAAEHGIVEAFRWKVTDDQESPPAPTRCLVLTGWHAGEKIACSKLDQTSILDEWHQENVIPNRVPW